MQMLQQNSKSFELVNSKSLIFKLSFFSPDAQVEDVGLNLQMRYEPGRLERLIAITNFSKQEIRMLYQGFKQVSSAFYGMPSLAFRKPNWHLLISRSS